MIRVVAGVAVRGRAALVCRRPPGKAHAGKWEFPGGKIEAGETLREALAREIREELRVTAILGDEIWRTEHRYGGGKTIVLHFVSIVSFEGEIDGSQFAEVCWQPINRLAELDFLEADREFIALLVEGAVR